MKIAILNNLYPPERRGGALKIAELMTKGFFDQGHHIFVISTSREKSRIEKRESARIYYLKSFYLKLHKFPLPIRLFWQLFNLFNLSKYLKIKRILKKEKPDLVITHNLQGLGQLTPRAIKKSGVKHFHLLHDIQLIHPCGLLLAGKEKKLKTISCRIYSHINKIMINSPDYVIWPSAWLMQKHKKKNFFPGSYIKILPHPIDSDPELKKIKKFQKFTLTYIGQLEKHKGADKLIKIFKDLNDREKGVSRLLIVGSGSLLPKLKKENKNNPRIIFTGWLSKKETNKTLARSHFLIIPSLCYENYPSIIPEAFNLETPVMASRLGGIPEIIKDEDFLFNPLNRREMKEKIKKAIKNYDSYQKNFLSSVYKNNQINSRQYIKKIEKLIKDNKS